MHNFLPNVHCPHCQAPLVVSISGFGAELSVRKKVCKRCGQEFIVNILTNTEADSSEVSDLMIASLRDTIRYWNSERRKTYTELLIKSEAAARIYREAVKMARRMRDNHLSN